MKHLILIFILATFLTACGGGGGGAAPSVNSDDSRDDSQIEQPILTETEQTQARSLANDLRSEIVDSGIGTEQDLLLRKIDSLVNDIDAARKTINDLLAEMTELRSQLKDALKVAETQTEPPPLNCGANEEIIGGSCKCVSGYVRKNNICEPESPPPNCGANEMADGQNCVCVDGYRRNNSGMCEMIPPIVLSPCDDGQDRVEGNCPPPQLPVCDGMNEVLRNGRCECRNGYVQNNNEICEMIPPPCSDFRERNAQGICTYNTPEFRRNPVLSLANPLPAYERGFFGQGVTVMLSDNGFLNTHEDLAGQFDENDISLSAQENRFADAQHGTNSAGILAARRNGIGMHGIAPSVIIVPVDSALYPNARWKHAVSVGIPIISESLGAGVEHFLVTAEFSAITATSSVYNRATAFAADVGESDVQLVRSNGNGGTHTKENLRPGDITAYFPFIDRNLEDNVLVVMALTTLNMPDDSTNGCGVAAEWCIGAVGDYHYTTDNNIPYRNLGIRGNTSAAAPVVSGALALLKSFRPELKMTVIRQVLLESARPLGTRKNDGMPDEIFGWGAVDVGNGIATLQAMQTADGMAYSDLRKSLPGEFSHLRGRMESVSVALRITDRSYYNMRLSDIVGGGDSDSHSASLGNAAKEMQADDSLSPENSGFGFNYANGDYDLHYAGGGGENAFRFSGGLRHDDSQSSYIGEGGGIFSAENASDTGGYVKWTTKNYGGISAFGEYGRTQIKADYDSASFISQIQNARAEEWTAGFQYRNLFLHNDSLRFSARQESRISGGEMVLHYPIADGDSHKAFIGESPQTIRTETAKIPIKQKPQTIYTAGYSQKTENSKWSAAAEWNSATNAKGVSFAVELQIR